MGEQKMTKRANRPPPGNNVPKVEEPEEKPQSGLSTPSFLDPVTYYIAKANEQVHDIRRVPYYIEIFILPFGSAFNPLIIPLWVFIAAQNAHAIFYVAAVLVTLGLTETLKTIIRRERPPEPRRSSGNSTERKMNHKRYFAFPTMFKTRFSMPSGDCAAAMLWCCTVRNRFQDTEFLDDSLYLLFFGAVAFARVFYRCHYFEDCFVGAFVGILGYQITSQLLPFRDRNLFYYEMAIYKKMPGMI